MRRRRYRADPAILVAVGPAGHRGPATHASSRQSACAGLHQGRLCSRHRSHSSCRNPARRAQIRDWVTAMIAVAGLVALLRFRISGPLLVGVAAAIGLAASLSVYTE
jgi:hypothetical protein